MEHSTATVNGIDVQTWDEASQPAEVKSEANRLAGSLPRGGDMGDSKGRIVRVDGPASPNGEMKIWIKSEDGSAFFYPPEGYRVKKVSGFESDNTAITIQRE